MMSQISTFPQINTRGRYDLWTGDWIGRGKKQFTLYPKKKFDKIHNAEEIVIFVHGMRNTTWGGRRGALTLRQRLRRLGYKKHPVVAFSYDADVRMAHIPSKYKNTLKTAYDIAIQNGIVNLPYYIKTLKDQNPNIKIHLVGHSLGCVVIYHCLHLLDNWGRNYIDSAHMMGSPVEYDQMKEVTHTTYIVNYYNPTDDVIIEGADSGELKLPTCLVKKVRGAKNIECLAKDHRFRSYARELNKFP